MSQTRIINMTLSRLALSTRKASSALNATPIRSSPIITSPSHFARTYSYKPQSTTSSQHYPLARTFSTSSPSDASAEVTHPFENLGSIPTGMVVPPAATETHATKNNTSQAMIEQDALGVTAGPAGVPLVFAPDSADINLMGLSAEFAEGEELSQK